MHKVLAKQLLAPGLMRIDVSAPDVAAKARPGQFVIVRAVEDGERIPLTIGGADAATGAIIAAGADGGSVYYAYG